jgi:hypothetical protein
MKTIHLHQNLPVPHYNDQSNQPEAIDWIGQLHKRLRGWIEAWQPIQPILGNLGWSLTTLDLLKLGLNPIVFVLNNNGYTIERLIHGRDASYNKVPDVGITPGIIGSAWSTDNILVGLLKACASLGAQVLVQVPRAH